MVVPLNHPIWPFFIGKPPGFGLHHLWTNPFWTPTDLPMVLWDPNCSAFRMQCCGDAQAAVTGPTSQFCSWSTAAWSGWSLWSPDWVRPEEMLQEDVTSNLGILQQDQCIIPRWKINKQPSLAQLGNSWCFNHWNPCKIMESCLLGSLQKRKPLCIHCFVFSMLYLSEMASHATVASPCFNSGMVLSY